VTLLRFSAAAVLLALAFTLGSIGLVALEVRNTVATLPSLLHREAEATRSMLGEYVSVALGLAKGEMAITRRTLDRRLASAEGRAVSEVQATRRDALAAIDQVSGRALTAIDNTRADLSGQLTTVNETLARETARLNTSVAVLALVAPPLTATMKRVQEVVEIGTDCEASPRCWQNTLYDVSVASQKSSAAFADLTAQTAGIATDVHTFTTEVVRPRTVRERLWAIVRATSGIAMLAWR
jgi:hypothetical protein